MQCHEKMPSSTGVTIEQWYIYLFLSLCCWQLASEAWGVWAVGILKHAPSDVGIHLISSNSVHIAHEMPLRVLSLSLSLYDICRVRTLVMYVTKSCIIQWQDYRYATFGDPSFICFFLSFCGGQALTHQETWQMQGLSGSSRRFRWTVNQRRRLRGGKVACAVYLLCTKDSSPYANFN